MNKFKTFAFLLGAVLIVSMPSCNKENEEQQEGVFTPGKKIHKIYYSNKINDEPRLSEEWHWNGDKLESIDYYTAYNGELSYKETFSYDGNHISRIDFNSNPYHITSYTNFDYEGNYLKTAKHYYTRDGETWIEDFTFAFSYQNEKLSQVLCDRYGSQSCNLTWDGDNLSAVDEIDKGRGGFINLRFEYDNKDNPMYGRISHEPWLIIEGIDFEDYRGPYGSFVSKNNCVKCTDEKGNTFYNIGYIYNEDGYPTQQTVTGKYIFHIFYYEYE